MTKIYPDGTQAVTDSDLLVPAGSLAILGGPSGCVSEYVEEAIADEAVDAAPVGDDLAARFIARVDARSGAGTGDTIKVVSRHEGSPLLRPRESPRDRRRQSGLSQAGLALALK